MLPFPSDQFTVPDPATATGVRPSVTEASFTPGVFDQLPRSFRPDVFQCGRPVDRTTGAALPVLVDVPADGAGRIIRIWPRARWPFGHQVTVSISAALPSAAGAPFDRPAGWTRQAIGSGGFTRDVTVVPSFLPHVRAIVQGQVRLTDFRTADGEIDQPNHGERRGADGSLQDLIEPRYLGRVTSMVTQSSIDFVALQKAIQTSFAELDVVTSTGFKLFSARPDGRPDFDPGAIISQGTSMGGVLGAAFLSITPEPLPAALLEVPGVGVSHIITNSALWSGVLAFKQVVPDIATPGEASALMGATQMALDQGDAGNWIDVAAANGTQMLVDYGLRDGIVPNESTERLLEIARIPLTGPVTAPVAHLPASPAVRRSAGAPGVPASGAVQVPSRSPDAFLEGLLGHLAFLQPEAVDAQEQWMDDVDRLFQE